MSNSTWCESGGRFCSKLELEILAQEAYEPSIDRKVAKTLALDVCADGLAMVVGSAEITKCGSLAIMDHPVEDYIEGEINA